MATDNLPHNIRAFTLIELMIVVAIVGVLAAIALPKFANLVRKSKEAATKGNLGSIRSTISIYYSDTEGTFPTDDLSCLTVGSKYIKEIPQCYVPPHHGTSSDVENNDDWGMGALLLMDNGSWKYWNWPDDPMMPQGHVWVGCTDTDTKGSAWSSH